MNLWIPGIVVVALIFLSSCTDQKAQTRLDNVDKNIKRLFENSETLFENDKKMGEAFDKTVEELNKNWKTLTESLDDRFENIRTFENDLAQRLSWAMEFQDYQQKRRKTVQLDLRSKAFGVFETGSGHLFLAIDEVERDEEGFILKSRIGNPTAATFVGCTVIARWGGGAPPEAPKGEEIKASDLKGWLTELKEWENEQETIEANIEKNIPIGAWTHVDIKLTPAEFSDLDHVFFQIKAGSLILKQGTR